MTAAVTISVVIPTLNEASHLARCVESVADADEIIVADGGSDDNTLGVAETLTCRVVTAPRGRGAQLAAGAAQATGGVLLFLHADCWFAHPVMQQLRQRYAQSPNLFGAFRQQIDDPRHRFRLLESGNAWRARTWGMPYGDQAVFVDRQSYLEAGGFPAEPLMEDVLLARRLRRHLKVQLLAGPLCVSARRWQRRGVIVQTLRNWALLAAFRAGVSTQTLARWYR